jgi:hypothetical protein
VTHHISVGPHSSSETGMVTVMVTVMVMDFPPHLLHLNLFFSAFLIWKKNLMEALYFYKF